MGSPRDDIRGVTIPLTGRLVTKAWPATIEKNFRSLKNMRYTDTGIKSVYGMSKVNATTALTTHLQVKSGYHFRKDQPAESHAIVQAFTSAGTASKVWDNTTAIGSQGDFSGTALLTESGATVGRFSSAPLGNVAYCNGVGSYIWGGNETRIGAFANLDLGGLFKYDFTDAMLNTVTTGAQNIATLTRVAGATDASTMLLFHFEEAAGDPVDSSLLTHVFTNANVTYDATQFVFGAKSGLFNGATAKLSMADDAHFDLSGGAFTIDCRLRLTALPGVTAPIYYHATDANNYFSFHINSAGKLVVSIYAASVEVVTTTSAVALSINTWYHVALAHSGNSYVIYVNGVPSGWVIDANQPANYTGTIYIGNDGSTNWLAAYVDEFRVSNTDRYNEAVFILPTAAYGSNVTWALLGSPRPLQGFKAYVGTANTTGQAGQLSVYYTTGTTWTEYGSITDGTVASANKSLSQTGSVSWTVAGTEKATVIDGKLLYWYLLQWEGIDNAVTLTRLTANAPFQLIHDIWDGIEYPCFSAQKYDGNNYQDYSVNVNAGEYDSANSGTYMELSDTQTSMYAVFGFTSPQTALICAFAAANVNQNAALATVYYWNGTTWVTVGDITDGTLVNGRSFGKSGIISWASVAAGSERPVAIGRETPLYYYKILWSGTITGPTVGTTTPLWLYYVAGIPCPRTMGVFGYPAEAMGRLWLLGETTQDKNRVIGSGYQAPDVWNGEDSPDLQVGDETEIVAGIGCFLQTENANYDALMVFKKTETWMIYFTGGTDGTWSIERISANIGCTAPGSLCTGTSLTEGVSRPVVLWQGPGGIYAFDGRSISKVSEDIGNIFDQNYDELDGATILTTRAAASMAFFDFARNEYHWLYTSGANTSHNEEMVFDLRRGRWFEIVRGTGKYLQCGFPAMDTNGNAYCYGGILTGYLEQLESQSGTGFDGTGIACDIRTGDFSLFEGSLLEQAAVRAVVLPCHIMGAADAITGSYFRDCSASVAADSFTLTPYKAGTTTAQPIAKLSGEGSGVFHAFRLQCTPTATYTFEPLYLGLFYKFTRFHSFAGE